VWGEGGHKVGQNGEKWIFFARNNFFPIFEKKNQNFKLFDHQNFEKSVNRARNAHIWVKFGSILAKMGHF
jgi:hypothetical protein